MSLTRRLVRTSTRRTASRMSWRVMGRAESRSAENSQECQRGRPKKVARSGFGRQTIRLSHIHAWSKHRPGTPFATTSNRPAVFRILVADFALKPRGLGNTRSRVSRHMKRLRILSLFPVWTAFCALICMVSQSFGTANAAVVEGVEWQPLSAQVRRVIEAMDLLGTPLETKTRQALQAAFQETDSHKGSLLVQEVLDARCLFIVHINPESRVKVERGAAPAELVEQGWRQFLLKVENEAGVTASLRVASPNIGSAAGSTAAEADNRWMD